MLTEPGDDAQEQATARPAVWPAHPDELQQAMSYATQTLHLYRKLHDPLWEADVLDAMGYISALLGDCQQAHHYCRSALRLFRRHHDRVGQGAALDTLGYIAHRSGRPTNALTYLHLALTLRRDVGNTYCEADTLSRLGDTLAVTGRSDDARAAWRQALGLYQTQHRQQELERVRSRLAVGLPIED